MSKKKIEVPTSTDLIPAILAKGKIVELIPRDLYQIYRRSLTKLLRDSLTLNDQLREKSPTNHGLVEDDIMMDFENVAEFLKYLMMKLQQKGVELED